MAEEIRVKVERANTETGEVLTSLEVKRHPLNSPTGPHDFGLNQQEQI